jgi:hypothetical protein
LAIEITRATLRDAEELGATMRDADAEEIRLIGGFTPYEAVALSIQASRGKAWSAWHKGRLVAVFGVADVSLLGGVGQPWALTSRVVDRIPKEYVLTSKRFLSVLRKQYSLLVTTIDARYGKALRWAEALGFTVHPFTPYGAAGIHFVSMKGDR